MLARYSRSGFEYFSVLAISTMLLFSLSTAPHYSDVYGAVLLHMKNTSNFFIVKLTTIITQQFFDNMALILHFSKHIFKSINHIRFLLQKSTESLFTIVIFKHNKIAILSVRFIKWTTYIQSITFNKHVTKRTCIQ